MMFHLARSVAFHAQQKEKLLNEKRLDVPGMRKYAGVVVSGYLTHEDKVAMNKLEKVLKCVFLLYTRIIVKHYIFFQISLFSGWLCPSLISFVKQKSTPRSRFWDDESGLVLVVTQQTSDLQQRF